MADFPDSSRMPTSIVAIGVGNRMRTYMHYVARHPELAKLVAVVEPDSIRRNAMADQFRSSAASRITMIISTVRWWLMWHLYALPSESISSRVWKR